MLRLLGILSLGNLLFGGRHHGRMLRRGLLFGALFGFFAHNDFDMNRVEEDIRNTAEKVKSTVSGAAKTAKQEMREARKAEHDQRVADHLNKVHADMEARKAEHDRRMAERMEAIRAEAEARRAARAARRADRENARPSRQITALPECNTREAKEIRKLAEDLERNARTAAMFADVPTIDFPEESDKYYSARKYGHA